MAKTSPSNNRKARPYHSFFLSAIFFCVLSGVGCDPAANDPTNLIGEGLEDISTESGCLADEDCKASFPGLPACRTAKCHVETGGCYVESIPNGLPCLSSDHPDCGGECIEGSCVPVFCDEDCSNGEDDDQDGATDCEDTECVDLEVCQSHPCAEAFALGCGDLIMGSTLGPFATDGITAVGCVGWDLSGPELTYRIPAGVAASYTATLDPKSADVRLAVLEGQGDGSCLPNACVAADENTVQWNAEADQEYLLVVDGFQGAAGAFALQFDCKATTETACNNGEDEDGDGAVDCEDTDCSLLPVCRECSPIASLGCGDVLSGSTLAPYATDVLTKYGCTEEEMDGAEVGYQIPAHPFPTQYTITMEEGDTALFVVALADEEGCEPIECVGTGNEVSWVSEPGVAYGVVIDSLAGDEGDYLFQMSCNLSTETNCSNGEDDDGDGAKDCEDSDCIGTLECETCEPLFNLSCGSEVTLSTDHLLATTLISSSGCSALSTPGPELVFSYEGTMDQNVQFHLESESNQAILTLFDLNMGEACDPDSCAGQGGNAITVETEMGTAHAVVVDSLSEEPVSFTLSVQCGSQEEWICNNGEDEDLDQLVDCLDPDCDNHPNCSKCLIVQDLVCGTELLSPQSTLFYTQELDLYGCGVNLLDGPEVTYRVAPKPGQTMDIQLDTLSEGAMVSLIEKDEEGVCDSSACLDSNPNGVSFTATEENPDALLVVDMPFSDTKPFTLTTVCSEVPELDCENAVDDDEDGMMDCADPDCFFTPSCLGGEVDCNNNMDDDENGYVDCNDMACMGAPNCGTCSSAAKIHCGETFMGLTGGTLSNTNISNYPCGNTPSLPGQEQTIRIAENLVGNTKLALYGDPQVHMALIAQSGPGCNASNCVDAFQLTGSNYNFIPQPGHTYYLVFDTSTSTPGGYSVELICASDTP